MVKIGLSKSDFDTNMQDMSEGQKKKVLIAKSISEQLLLKKLQQNYKYRKIIVTITYIIGEIDDKKI